MLLAMTGSSLPGSTVVFAEGITHGRGPVVFRIPQASAAIVEPHTLEP